MDTSAENPVRVKRRHVRKITPLHRFWSQVEKLEKGCWVWNGRKNKEGYGCFFFKGHLMGVHRFSWMIHVGEIPDGLQVCHNCPTGDNPACVNPEHLWLGTQPENIADKVKKGRQSKGAKHAATLARLSGEENPLAKLTWEIVDGIRADHKSGLSYSQIAAKWGAKKSNIASIITGKTWTKRPESS